MTHIGWNFQNTYAQLPKSFFISLKPTPVHSPKLVILNRPMAAFLGLNIEELKGEEGVQELVGNRIPAGASPLAQAYAGHQFGHFTMLGDGRAVLIGEHITPAEQRFDIQLKGAGRTPYSRGGDGRAALGPMLREYIISEAMHALGIPTTRSLAVVTTGEAVYRETELPGAVLTRVASSHIRVGTFQYAANWGSMEDIRILADYTIQRHYPEIKKEEYRYLLLLKNVIDRQASLIAKWQLAGFIHGVMNTDNMAISGETIDYGPCAFMDVYNPATVFSSIDVQGRYAYGNQPSIAAWNLARFAETLLPLLHTDQEQAIQIAQKAISNFPELYRSYWLKGMRKKLGLHQAKPQDKSLVEELLNLMEKYSADYTNTFRALTFDKIEGQKMFKTTEFTAWYAKWHERIEIEQTTSASVQKLMKENNANVIPRNHRVEEALKAAVDNGDYKVMEKLVHVLSHPYDHSTKHEEYTKPTEQSIPYVTYCGT